MTLNNALEILLSLSMGAVLAMVYIGLHKGLKRLLRGNKNVSTSEITAYYSNRLELDETLRRGTYLLLSVKREGEYNKKVTILVDRD